MEQSPESPRDDQLQGGRGYRTSGGDLSAVGAAAIGSALARARQPGDVGDEGSCNAAEKSENGHLGHAEPRQGTLEAISAVFGRT